MAIVAITSLAIIWSFWLLVIVGAALKGRSIFPIPLIPFAASLLQAGVDRWFFPLGSIVVGGLHVGLWCLLFFLWMRDKHRGS